MTVPDFLPILSAGCHGSPAEGACFMEFASFLAGEPFSDRPRCTHPLLAETARTVNDLLDDEQRQQLLPLIPRVIGTAHGLTLTVDLAVDLAAWCARYAQRSATPHHVVETVRFAAAKRDAGDPAGAVIASATLAAFHAACVAYIAGDGVGFLTGLIDEYERLTGHQPVPVTADQWAACRALVTP